VPGATSYTLWVDDSTAKPKINQVVTSATAAARAEGSVPSRRRSRLKNARVDVWDQVEGDGRPARVRHAGEQTDRSRGPRPTPQSLPHRSLAPSQATDIIDSMAQLIVRNIEEEVVEALKIRAAQHGRSAEAEHRELLRQALLRQPSTSLKEHLMAMPDAGTDVDFEARREGARKVEF